MYVNLTGSTADMVLLVVAFLAGAAVGAILVLISGKRIVSSEASEARSVMHAVKW